MLVGVVEGDVRVCGWSVVEVVPVAGEVVVNGEWLETISRWAGLRRSIDTVSRRPLMLIVKASCEFVDGLGLVERDA